MFTSSANSLHTNSWLEEWRKIMQSESAEIPSVTRNRLLEPLKLSDPVFCSALCQELVSTANITVIFNVLCDPNPSKCEVLFYLCKCSSPESRLFVASVVPALLWIEWIIVLRSGPDVSEEVENDIAAIKVALLAAYQQDYNICPLPPVIRTTTMSQPSIYYDGKSAKEIDLEVFPFNTTEATLTPSPTMFPPQALDKFDDYSRPTIMYRLCRFCQDHLPEVGDQVLVVYGILISRLAVMGTLLEQPDLLYLLQSGSLFSSVSFRERFSTQRLSDLTFEVGSVDLQESKARLHVSEEFKPEHIRFVQTCFFPDTAGKARRRYPMPEQLALLWSDALALIKCRFPTLEEHVRNCLLARARHLGYPAAIASLSL